VAIKLDPGIDGQRAACCKPTASRITLGAGLDGHGREVAIAPPAAIA